MNRVHNIKPSEKNKQLSFEHYEYIINEIIKHEAKYNGQVRNTGKTQLIRDLAAAVGTSVSNVYEIIKAARTTIKDTHLVLHEVLSATAAWNRRHDSKPSNNTKLKKAKPFIDLVVKEVKSNTYSSIDETVNYLRLHEPEKIKDMETVCTKTIYNYVHQRKIALKPIDLPRMLRRRPSTKHKTYIPKMQRGTSITERDPAVETREDFGHWEGDLVVGPRNGQNGAYLTLVERKTRFYLMIPVKNKTAKQVYMQINKLHRFYSDDFSEIFKTITFDNGSEFARWKDIEVKPGTSKQRTKVYFGRPYRSSDRGSNENANQLIRYTIPKGTDINTVPKEKSVDINNKINQKKRKILGYLPAETLFIQELNKLGRTENLIFYKS